MEERSKAELRALLGVEQKRVVMYRDEAKLWKGRAERLVRHDIEQRVELKTARDLLARACKMLGNVKREHDAESINPGEPCGCGFCERVDALVAGATP